MEDNILEQEQIDKLTSAFIAARQIKGEPEPTPEEIDFALKWFSDVARGAVLMRWVLNGELIFSMDNNVITFLEFNAPVAPDELSPLIFEQIESIDSDDEN